MWHSSTFTIRSSGIWRPSWICWATWNILLALCHFRQGIALLERFSVEDHFKANSLQSKCTIQVHWTETTGNLIVACGVYFVPALLKKDPLNVILSIRITDERPAWGVDQMAIWPICFALQLLTACFAKIIDCLEIHFSVSTKSIRGTKQCSWKSVSGWGLIWFV